ncbi:MAG TPA: hypothetical protein PLX23_07775 [Candidatus Hydrogenedens sp.]|nr:hypothetical protein [Candidatus Hydrogenedens sp.]
MNKLWFSLLTFFFCLCYFPISHAELIFDKEYQTGLQPVSKIIRYRVIYSPKQKYDYAFNFSGKLLCGALTIKVEDREGEIIKEQKFQGKSLINSQFTLPSSIELNNIHISLNFEEAAGDVYTAIAPNLVNKYIQIYKTVLFSGCVIILIFFGIVLLKEKVTFSLLLWGIGIGLCSKVLIYYWQKIDPLSSKLIFTTASSKEGLSLFIEAFYFSLTETLISFLILGIFLFFKSIPKDKKAGFLSFSIGITLVWVLEVTIQGMLSYSVVSLSIFYQQTPLFLIFILIRNIILCGLWFTVFYVSAVGSTNAETRLVVYGILILFVTESIQNYFNQSNFLLQNSSWWHVVSLLFISFLSIFPYMIIKGMKKRDISTLQKEAE